MFNRITRLSLVLVALLSARLVAQDQGPTPEQQEMFEQMRQMREQVMQRMQEKGIDPIQFGQQMREQMMDGTFDQATFQQSMIDRGLVDQDQMDRMQNTMQRLTMSGLKQRLEVSEEDWKVIEPKLKQVVALRAASAQPGQFGGMMGLFAGAASVPAAANVNKAMSELRLALKNPQAKPDVIAAKLEAWRKARDQAREELGKAQADLVGVLRVRQEGILMAAGMIQ
jgi:hypothetical protein